MQAIIKSVRYKNGKNALGASAAGLHVHLKTRNKRNIKIEKKNYEQNHIFNLTARESR